MAVNSTRKTEIYYSGDLNSEYTFQAASNPACPGSISVMTLVSGNNTITLPTSGTVVKGATVIPPPGNTASLILKGQTGDNGIAMNKLDPFTITFDSPAPANFVLTAGASIMGLRIVWT